jgi:ABC-type amino acid transport substrate-binding protein
LAVKIGVKYVAVEYPRPGAVLEGILANACDVAFLVFEASRAEEADFSHPYMRTDFTYLVPIDSPIRQVAGRLPGLRVLDEPVAPIFYAALVPKGQADQLAYVNEFIEEAKATGLVKRIIETAGLRGVQVAPADTQ